MINKSNGLNYYKMLIDDINSNKINAFKFGLQFRDDYSSVKMEFVYDIDEHTLIPIRDYGAYMKYFSINMHECPYPIVTLNLQITDLDKEAIKEILINNILYHQKQMLANEEEEFIKSANGMSNGGLLFDFSNQDILASIKNNQNVNLLKQLSLHSDLFNFFFMNFYEKVLKTNFDQTLNSFFKDNDDPFIPTAMINNVLMKLFYLSIASLKRGKINSSVATAQIVSIFNVCNDQAAYENGTVDKTKELFLFLKSHANDNFSKDNINTIISTYQAIERKNFEK